MTDHPALELLDVMWGDGPEAWSTLTHREGEGPLVHTAVRTDDRDSWIRWLAEHQDTDCYYRVCPMAEKPDLPAHRGDAAASTAVPALFADIDVRSAKHPTAPEQSDVRRRLHTLNALVRLSLVVNTGNGWQVYVPFDEPADPSIGRGLLARWVKQLKILGLTDDRKGDLASLLRLPGTRNTNGGHTTALQTQGDRFGPWCSLADLDDLLPALEPGEEPAALDGVGEATDLEVEAFLCLHTAEKYPRALQRAIEGIDATVRRNGGARHPSLRMYLWQALAESMVGAYPARRAVVEGYAYWQRHVAGERRPRNELLNMLHWQVPKVAARTDLAEVRARLDEHFDQVRFNMGADPMTGEIKPDPPRNLPEEFWQRSELAALRRWAHGRGRSADSVYGAVRARLNTLVPYSLRIDTGLAMPISLNSLIALVARPGGGKTTSEKLGRELVSLTLRDDVYEVPMGSGEGVVEAFYEWVDVPNPNPNPSGKAKPTIKKKEQTKRGVLLVMDEGEAMTQMAGRQGSTLLPTLRSAYSGAMLGQSNAKQENRRILAANEYRLVLLILFQDLIAAEFFGDLKAGTPQRFIMFNANDPTIPVDPQLAPPPWTGVPWTPPRFTGSQGQNMMTLAPAVRAEVRERDSAVQRGTLELDPLDAHRDQNRIVEAGMLAIQQQRLEISEEDWRLAGMVLDTSDSIRRWVMEQGWRARQDVEDERTNAAVKRQVRTARAIADDAHDRAVLGGARAMARLASRADPDVVTLRDLSRAPASKHRKLASVDEMIGRAEEFDWLREVDGGWRVGGSTPL